MSKAIQSLVIIVLLLNAYLTTVTAITNTINQTNKKQIIFLEKFIELFCGFKYSRPYFGNYTSPDEIKYSNIVFVDDYDKCSEVFVNSCEYFDLTWSNYHSIGNLPISQIIPDSDIEKITGKLFKCIELSNKTIGPVPEFFWKRPVTNLESIITHWDQIPHDKKSHYVSGIIDSIHPNQLHQVINHFTDLDYSNNDHHKNHLINSVNRNQAYLHKYKLNKYHQHLTPTHINTIDSTKLNTHDKHHVKKQKFQTHSNSRPKSKMSQDISSVLYTGNSKSKLKYKQKLLVITLCALFGWCGIALCYLAFRHVQIWCLSRQMTIHPESLRTRTTINPN